MILAILGLVLLALIYLPQIWVRYVLNKHSRTIEQMPGTGGELAEHLIQRFKLTGVSVSKVGNGENYYAPQERRIGLEPRVYEGRSLTAVATATHEVGHAIQYHRQEAISRLRGRFTPLAARIQTIGVYILGAAPLLGIVARTPGVMILLLGIGIAAMLASVALHAMVLPEELDASFGKAMPILEEGYVPDEHLPAIRQVLRACALTYVAAALADVLSIWRWLAILR